MWIVLTDWITVAVVIPILIGIGMGVLSMNPPEYVIAKISFSIAAAILLTRIVWWLAFEQTASIVQRIVFVFLIFGVIGSLWLISLKWINDRQVVIKAQINGKTLETISGKSDFKINLLHAMIGLSPDKKDVTGIVLHLRIMNAGKASIATNWKLTIKTPTEKLKPVGPATTLRELTFTTRAGKKKVFKESDFSFEKTVSINPLNPGDPPVEGWLLFYVKIPKEKVNWTDAVIQLTVEDHFGRISSPATKEVGDWIQWE